MPLALAMTGFILAVDLKEGLPIAGWGPLLEQENASLMYPYFRLLRVLARARSGHRLDLDGKSVLTFRAWPGDIDIFPEMNNGRQLTVMDLGRFDLGARTGLNRLAHRRKWGFAVAGASVRYRRRIRPFRKFSLSTRLLGFDERWFYFIQEYRCGDILCSSALIRAGVTSRSGLVSTAEVLEAMGAGDWNPELPGWVRAWIEADDRRPQE
jgi:acyl-CoA thioesterase FadM